MNKIYKKIALLLVGLLPFSLQAQKKQEYKIVIGVIMDQFRYDYLDRYDKYFLPAGKKSGGFKRLLKNGAFFTDAHYTHSGTYTAPGHSTYYSGLLPFQTGIIANEWYDKKLRKGVYCVSDSTVHSVGIPLRKNPGLMSPRNYSGTTLADHFKEKSPESKSIAVAIKDRGSVLGAGVKANGAFWFDIESGKWISSTYYFRDGKLPTWAEEFNARKLPDSYIGKSWNLLLPESSYYLPDSAKSEGFITCEKTISFPHILVSGCDSKGKPTPKYGAVGPTPYGNELTIEIAKAAIEGEKLGQRGVTDFLGISFSSTDYCGHIFGPDSREEMDMIIRLDRQLDEFFKELDKTVGFDNCLFYVSADHGVSPIPEQTSDGARLSPEKFIQFVKDKLYIEYPDVITTFENDEFYLDSAKIAALGHTLPDVEVAVGKIALLYPGVTSFYAKSFLLNGNLDSLGKQVFNSIDKNRSGDVHIILNQHTFFSSSTTGTTHGSPYDYDNHVPVIITGKGIIPGRYSKKVAVIDVFPTIAELIHVQAPNRKGRILKECLKQ